MRRHALTTTATIGLITVALGAAPSTAQTPALSLNPDQTCYDIGDPVIVDIDMTESQLAICAAQMFLAYDEAKLDFVSMTPSGDGPFSFQLFESVDEELGLITYAVAQFPNCTLATQGPARVATITFTALDNCFPTLDFVPHDPPTLLSGNNGASVEPVLTPMEPVKIDDGTVPIVVCPDTVIVCADADTQTGVAEWPAISDGCGFAVDATCDALSGDAFPMGVTTVHCSATEFCGLSDSCSFDVSVVDPIPDTGPGDSTGDLVVDLSDYIGFVDCFSGSGTPPTPDPSMCVEACLSAFDSDIDGDVDLLDFGAFQTVFTTP